MPDLSPAGFRRSVLGRPRLFTSNFTGFANRLEGLTLSFAIAGQYGHEVCLDWPEFDVIEIAGTTARGILPWERIGSLKLRDCDEETFDRLGQYRNILQRGMYGPAHRLDPIYLETARRIRLKPHCAQAIREGFRRVSGCNVVGVHLRSGDFPLLDPDDYDATRRRHQEIPLWWYEHVMDCYAREFPQTMFLLSHSGDPKRLGALRSRPDTFEMEGGITHRTRVEGHRSQRHPVIDLFALACCRVLIATPGSSFSHFAANALGGPATTVVPAPRTSRTAPAFGIVSSFGHRLEKWMSAVSGGDGFRPVKESQAMPVPMPPQLDWLSR